MLDTNLENLLYLKYKYTITFYSTFFPLFVLISIDRTLKKKVDFFWQPKRNNSPKSAKMISMLCQKTKSGVINPYDRSLFHYVLHGQDPPNNSMANGQLRPGKNLHNYPTLFEKSYYYVDGGNSSGEGSNGTRVTSSASGSEQSSTGSRSINDFYDDNNIKQVVSKSVQDNENTPSICAGDNEADSASSDIVLFRRVSF
jgi:hypothetical protein